jgi:hypothetical protein
VWLDTLERWNARLRVKAKCAWEALSKTIGLVKPAKRRREGVNIGGERQTGEAKSMYATLEVKQVKKRVEGQVFCEKGGCRFFLVSCV